MTATHGPYVGLDAFHEEDAALFFGRDAERTRIIGNLRASRLTLLHAESGVGKSSLLRAGVSARLTELADGADAFRYVPVVFSGWGTSPTQGVIASLETAAGRVLGDGATPALRHDTLRLAMEDACDATEATVLLILDQFEEHFLYATQDAERFDDELAHCIVDRDLRAHFLISVREDAYALIGQRFKARIPNVYGNYLHLDFLDERAARLAVVRPLEAFSRRVPSDELPNEVEEELVDAVLAQVRRGRVTIGEQSPADAGDGGIARVETAYLQLVMQRIWDEEVAAGSRRLRHETLLRLGGAGTIVRAHLDDAMAQLTAEQRDAAADAFRFLITSGGRKIALTSHELAEFAQTSTTSLEPALARLERRRILRPTPSPEHDGAIRRELYHDVLAPAVLDWRRRHLEDRRRSGAERSLALAREQSRYLESRNRLLSAAVLALLALLVAVGALSLYTADPGWLRRLEVRALDARFAIRGERPPDPRLRLIAVDDRALALRGDRAGRIPRADYARVLRAVGRDRPAVIALDVIFAAGRDPRGTGALRAAIRATRDRLVLPYDAESLEFATGLGGVPGVRPVLFGHVRRPGARTGFAGLPEDPDGRIRRANYVVEFGAGGADASAETLAFAAADVARDGELRRRLPDLPRAARGAWGGQSPVATWIDFQGGPGDIPRTSVLDVLGGRVPAGAFRDKLVVIGVTARRSPDLRRTPIDDDRPMSGPELQAAALGTMVRDMPLRDAGPPADIVAVVLVACLGASAALWRSRVLGILALIAIAGGFLVVAQIAFHAGRILAVFPPLCALALAVLGVTGFEIARKVRRASTGG